MSRVLALAVIAFSVTLAAVVGNRMGGEAMAVVVGVVCGVAASIPMSLLILLVVNRSKRQQENPDAQVAQLRPQGNYPPVIVVQGGAPNNNPWSTVPGAGYGEAPYDSPSPALEAGERKFRLVGEE